ncbi:MAG TPA: hypothetical protein VMH92_05755 [Acidocella sp.]|nr:hypothetical protein [Acidocella sp.]
MNVTKIAKLLPALGLACMVSLPAMAQTATAPAAATTAAPAAPAASGTMAPAPAAAPAAAKPAKAKHTSHAALPANEQFTTLEAATSHCPSDTVEWTALGHSKSYHASTSKLYGKTKHGAYACKSDLDAAGFHQAKN